MSEKILKNNLNIRNLRIKDWKFVKSCDEVLQWGFSNDGAKFHLSICQSAFIAELEEIPVGMVFGYKWGSNIGWIGQLIVKEEFRLQSIGRRLLRTQIEELRNSGCATIGLDAVPPMLQFYESEGFSCCEKSLRFNRTWTKGKSAESVRYAIKSDLDSISRFDKQLTGFSRFKLLENTHISFPKSILVKISDNEIQGYMAYRYRPNLVQIGPWISQSQKSAEEMLQHFLFLLNAENIVIRVGVLESGVTPDTLEDLGFKELFFSYRMYRGPALRSPEDAFLCIGDPAWG